MQTIFFMFSNSDSFPIGRGQLQPSAMSIFSLSKVIKNILFENITHLIHTMERNIILCFTVVFKVLQMRLQRNLCRN